MTYTTIQGETWDSIAYKLYGKGDMMPKLMAANLDFIETAIFESGVTLNVPEINTSEVSATLPPWKRSDSP